MVFANLKTIFPPASEASTEVANIFLLFCPESVFLPPTPQIIPISAAGLLKSKALQLSGYCTLKTKLSSALPLLSVPLSSIDNLILYLERKDFKQ